MLQFKRNYSENQRYLKESKRNMYSMNKLTWCHKLKNKNWKQIFFYYWSKNHLILMNKTSGYLKSSNYRYRKNDLVIKSAVTWLHLVDRKDLPIFNIYLSLIFQLNFLIIFCWNNVQSIGGQFKVFEHHIYVY